MGAVVNLRSIKTYGMSETADHLDFDIREHNVKPAQTAPHRHEYFQIQINLTGNTQQTVGGSVRPFRRGCISFILPHRVHFIPHPPGSRYIIMNVAQRFLRQDLQVDPLDLEDVPISQAPELAPFLFQEYIDFDFSESELADIEAITGRMLTENAARRFGSLGLLRGLLLQLIALACRKYESEILRLAASQAQQTSRRDALQRVAHYIRARLTEEVTLSDAAAAAFLSPSYLAHLLKKETGKTFTALVTERRMERAQELLANTSARIAEVAHASGFADEAYFTRRFKQWFGLSPRAYRDSVRASISSPR